MSAMLVKCLPDRNTLERPADPAKRGGCAVTTKEEEEHYEDDCEQDTWRHFTAEMSS